METLDLRGLLEVVQAQRLGKAAFEAIEPEFRAEKAAEGLQSDTEDILQATNAMFHVCDNVMFHLYSTRPAALGECVMRPVPCSGCPKAQLPSKKSPFGFVTLPRPSTTPSTKFPS